MDLHEDFTRDISVDNKELIKFWKSSTCRLRSMTFLKDSSTLRDMALA